MRIRHYKIVIATLLLTACAAPDPGHVPVTIMGVRGGVSNVGEMTVRAGQTPESISQTSGLDIVQLLQMNGLVSQQRLAAGQRLKVPIPDSIKIIEGDTIDTIAKAFGIDRNAIVRENDLKPPFALARGQILRLPSDAALSPAAPLSVSSGDLTEMANNAPVADNIITTTETTSGATIHQSAAGVITEENLAPLAGVAQSDRPVVAPQMALATPQKPIVPITSPGPAAPAVQSLGSGIPHFSWPVNGSVLSGYGPKPGGQHNDGLNIGAPLGSPVRAAAAGEVVYVGDNVAGFGNLVLLRHSGGYATAYGHLQNPLVKRGERIAAGQAIAQVGKTGNVRSPQVHFEVRQGVTAVNPRTYLP